MCQICAQFTPYTTGCDYEALTDTPPVDHIPPTGAYGAPGGAGGSQPAAMTVTETGDAAGSTATTYSMAVGDYFHGTLSPGTDSDWVAVTLQAGQTYTFAMVGTGALGDSADDPYLRLRDASGSVLAQDDDGGPGTFSTIASFTAGTTGTYYLDAQSYSDFSQPADPGTYGLSVTMGDKASYDIAMGAGALIRPDASWSATPGTGASVSWGIRSSGAAADAQGNPVGFEGLTAAQAAAAQEAMALVDGVSGLSFAQVNPGGTTNNATILFGGYSSFSDGSGAYAYFPGNTSAASQDGDVWLNNTQVSTSSLPFGSYSFFTVLHEIGHAVGLAHPGDYNAAPGVPITYANDAQFIEDGHQYTVMSYFDESNTTTDLFSYPDTLLLYDLYALHQLYGADASYMSGNTTYGFNATAGGTAYDFTLNTDPLLSIWDGGGTDKIDLSGWNMAQVLNLGDGTFSDVGGFAGNLSIAAGAVIENGTGGGGADSITGNAADNRLQGNGGLDFIYGLEGNDRIYGNAGRDRLDGAEGRDKIWAGVGNDRAWGGGDKDTIRGGKGNDRIWGNGGADSLIGQSGNDRFVGGAGGDRFVFEDGFDADTIVDFNPFKLTEKIKLAGVSSITGYTDLMNNHISQAGADVLIDAGGGDTITLMNTSLGDLGADSFLF